MLLNGDRSQSSYFAQVLAIGIHGCIERVSCWTHGSGQHLPALQKPLQASDRSRYPAATTVIKAPAFPQLLRRQHREAALSTSPEVFLNRSTAKHVALARRVSISLPE